MVYRFLYGGGEQDSVKDTVMYYCSHHHFKESDVTCQKHKCFRFLYFCIFFLRWTLNNTDTTL